MTHETPVYQNAHEQIIPFHVFKHLELAAVLRNLLPKVSQHGR